MANKSNLVIDQGSTYSSNVVLTDDYGDPRDLTGYTANSQIRKWYTSSNATASFTTSINTAAGVITLNLTANQTSSIEAGRYVYDVEIANGSVVTRVVEGIVTVTPQVTR
jgi:hypothetical protein